MTKFTFLFLSLLLSTNILTRKTPKPNSSEYQDASVDGTYSTGMDKENEFEDDQGLEFHDDTEESGQKAQDPFDGMSEEEKNRFIQAQQMKMTSCILYTQIYANREKETITEIMNTHDPSQKS